MRVKCLAERTFGAGTSAPPLARASVVAPTGSATGMTSPLRSRGRGRSSALPLGALGLLRVEGDEVHGGVAFAGSFGTMRGLSFARGASTPWKRARG